MFKFAISFLFILHFFMPQEIVHAANLKPELDWVTISKKDLLKNFPEKGERIFNWLVETNNAMRISSSKCRIFESTDLVTIRVNMKKYFPKETNRFINRIENIFYNSYLRRTIFSSVKDRNLEFKKNYNIHCSFLVSVKGSILNVKLTPLTKDIPEPFLKQVQSKIAQLSFKPLPESIVRFHRGCVNKELFSEGYKNGEEIFDQLVKSKYLKEVSDRCFRPIDLSDNLTGFLNTKYSQQAQDVEEFLTNLDSGQHFNIELRFDYENWLEKLFS